MKCLAAAFSPWVRGMTMRCHRPEGHDGRHRVRTDLGEVEWTGQNDRLTDIERRRDERNGLRRTA